MPDKKSVDEVVSEVIQREDRTGSGVITNDPLDTGGRTQWGISEKANPEVWADGVLTEQERRDTYLKKYVKGPKFDLIPDANLMAQLIDFGVNSGPGVATMKLQGILGVKVDGDLGPKTLEALTKHDSREINNLLMAERIKMIGRIVQKNPSQIKWLSGWLSRALEFLR